MAQQTRSQQAETLLRGVRLGLINNSNKELKLYGLTSLDLKLVCNESVLTMGVDGTHLFYNSDFVLGLEKDKEQQALDKLNTLKPLISQEEYDNQLYRIKVWYGSKDRKTFEFLFRHEIDHILLDHMENKGTRDPQLWNISCDHRINNDIVTSWYKNISDVEKHLPLLKGVCCDKKYKGKEWTSPSIYDDLVKNEQKNKQNGNSKGLDSHIYPDGQSQGQGKSDQVTRDILGLPANFENQFSGDSNSDKKVDSKVAGERLKNSFVEAAKQVGIGEGNGILDAIKISKPIINWKKVLRKNLSGLNKIENDPKRISRRIHGITSSLHDKNMIDSRDHLFTSGKKLEPTVKVYIMFDTSGSISDKERNIMLTETFGICTQYKSFELTVACWGSNFLDKSLKVFSKKNKSELKDYKFHAGGGTDINCISEFLEKQKLKPTDKIVVFTDCYFGDPRIKLTKFSKHLIFVSTQKNMEYACREIGRYIQHDKHQ